MFRKNITSTPFTTDAANSFFGGIIDGGTYPGGDVSFLATVRALIYPRMKEGDKLSVKFSRSSYGASTLDGNPAERVLNAMVGDRAGNDAYTDAIEIHSLSSGSADNNKAIMDRVVRAKFLEKYPGFQRVEKIHDFYAKSFDVECYVNADRRCTYVFVGGTDIRKLHYLQASTLVFFPWYFDPSAGVSKDEMELMYSLRETLSDKYEACLAKMAEKYDFRSASIRKILEGFEGKRLKMQKSSYTTRLAEIDESIKEFNNRIAALLSDRENACIYLLGLENKLSSGSGENEMMDYFLANKSLHLISQRHDTLTFVVKDYVEYFDPDLATSTIENKRSFVYATSHGNGISADDMQMLLHEIFVGENPRVRLKVCAAYEMSLSGSVEALSHYEFGAEFSDCMPNPHINQYSCMGGYTGVINELAQKCDYIGIVEQCVASARNLNWGDSTVMRRFMEFLWGGCGSQKFLELSDGAVVGPVEAVAWLKGQEK